MPTVELPSPRDIYLAPERASLAVLQAALLVAEQALVTQHPTATCRDEPRHFDPPTLALARDFLRSSGALRQLIARYLRTVDQAADLAAAQDDVIPF